MRERKTERGEGLCENEHDGYFNVTMTQIVRGERVLWQNDMQSGEKEIKRARSEWWLMKCSK